MGIYKRGEMYWARWSEGGHIERRSLDTKDRAEAERRFKDVRVRRTEGATLKACFEGWLAYKRLAHRAHPRSIENFATASRRFVAEWGHVAAERGLSVVDIDRFKTERLTIGMLPSTVNNDLMSLHNALAWAKRAGLYPAEIPETKLLKVAKRRVPKFLAPRDVDALLDACERGGRYLRVAPFVQLAAYAGMRRDEIRWLTWGDVDLDRGLVSVVEKPGEWSPKSFERSVDIDAELAGWLKAWQDRVRQYGCGVAMGDWVAPFWPVAEGRGANQSRPGVQWCRVWIGQEIRALFEAAGVERPRNAAHTLHMLRGTYAVRLLQGGADLETVRQLLGHANIATTAIYLSATSGSRRRALKGLREPLA